MEEYLTEVESNFQDKILNFRLIFGKPVRTEVVFRKQFEAKQLDYFAPGSLFCMDFWRGGQYGTKAWRVIVARSLAPDEDGVRVPQITQNVRIIFDVSGALKAKAALKWIGYIQEIREIHTLPDKFFEIANLRLNTMSVLDLKNYTNPGNANFKL